MKLEGIHHITAITADAPANLSFYSDLLGLRFIKKTVNFDDPTAYHLYYGDEVGHPGSILTFFEYPGASRGSAGQGMIHRIAWRVADEEALDFWEERLRRNDVPLERFPGALRFRDPEGLELELAASRTQGAGAHRGCRRHPAAARHPGVRRRARVHVRPAAQRRAAEGHTRVRRSARLRRR